MFKNEYLDLVMNHWYYFIPLMVLLPLFGFCMGMKEKKTRTSPPPKKKNKATTTSTTSSTSTTTSSPSTTKKSKDKESLKIEDLEPVHITDNNEDHNSKILLKSIKSQNKSMRSFVISPDGKFVGQTCDDSFAKLMSLPMESTGHNTKIFTINLQNSVANAIAFGESNDILYLTLKEENKLVKYEKNAQDNKWTRKFETKFDLKVGKQITTLLSNPLYTLICTDDTTIRLFSNEKGALISSIDTGSMKHYMASQSANGRFFAVASFSSEIGIYEFILKKDKSYDKCAKVMTLTGYNTSVFGISFNRDGTRLVAVSKDGLIKYWNLDVQYNKGEDPQLLFTAPSSLKQPNLISLSPDSTIFVVGTQNKIEFRSTVDGALLTHIEKVNEYDFNDNNICWTPDSKYFITGGYSTIHLWYVPTVKKNK